MKLFKEILSFLENFFLEKQKTKKNRKNTGDFFKAYLNIQTEITR